MQNRQREHRIYFCDLPSFDASLRTLIEITASAPGGGHDESAMAGIEVERQPSRVRQSSTGLPTLIATIVLCLPSVVGAGALLVQSAVYADITRWQETPSAFIAFGAILGGPLAALAAGIGALVSLTRASANVKRAHLGVVAAGAIATVVLLLRFAT